MTTAERFASMTWAQQLKRVLNWAASGSTSGSASVAARGILCRMFQGIAPEVHLDNAWLPPMGTLAGFFVGIPGAVLIE